MMINTRFPSLIATEVEVDAFDACLDAQFFRSMHTLGCDEARRLVDALKIRVSHKRWARDFSPMIHDAWLFTTQGQL